MADKKRKREEERLRGGGEKEETLESLRAKNKELEKALDVLSDKLAKITNAQ